VLLLPYLEKSTVGTTSVWQDQTESAFLALSMTLSTLIMTADCLSPVKAACLRALPPSITTAQEQLSSVLEVSHCLIISTIILILEECVPSFPSCCSWIRRGDHTHHLRCPYLKEKAKDEVGH